VSQLLVRPNPKVNDDDNDDDDFQMPQLNAIKKRIMGGKM
jgi:hypothetical protein